MLISVETNCEVEHEDNVVLDTSTFPVFSGTVSYSKLTTIDDTPLTTLPKQNPHKSRSKPTGNLIIGMDLLGNVFGQKWSIESYANTVNKPWTH